MLRTKIRTVGFALLGGGRTDDKSSAPPPLAMSEELKRLGAGGWGKSGGEVQLDKELEDLMASDEQAATPAGGYGGSVSRPVPAAGGGGSAVNAGGRGKYHRVGTATETQPITDTDEAEPVGAAEEAEGYYELCVKSVEAVKWDPEVDDSSP